MPDAAWPVQQAPAGLIPAQHNSPVSTSCQDFRHLNGSSLVVRLPVSHLTPRGAFSVTLTTRAFDPAPLTVVCNLFL